VWDREKRVAYEPERVKKIEHKGMVSFTSRVVSGWC
jgi:hypothetical protein